MRTLKVWPVAIACITASLVPLSLHAQQHSTLPELEILEEGEAPVIAARPKVPGHQSEEIRAPGGKVTEVKVTTRGSTYYLKPNDLANNASAGNQQNSQLRAAQWQILVFDLNRTKNPEEAVANQGTVPLQPVPIPKLLEQQN